MLKAVTASVGAAAAAVAAAGGDAIVVRAAIVLALRQSLTPEGKVLRAASFKHLWTQTPSSRLSPVRCAVTALMGFVTPWV